MKSAISRAAAALGKKGGKARASKLSPERQVEIARLGGMAKSQKAKDLLADKAREKVLA